MHEAKAAVLEACGARARCGLRRLQADELEEVLATKHVSSFCPSFWLVFDGQSVKKS